MILRTLGDEEALYRVIVPRWSYAPTSGAGAAVKGGRLNRKGFEALYLAQTTETALAEYRQYERLLVPGTLVTYLVSGVTVVDFSAGYAAGQCEPIWAEYNCNWRKLALEQGVEPPSGVLGDLALDAGASGCKPKPPKIPLGNSAGRVSGCWHDPTRFSAHVCHFQGRSFDPQRGGAGKYMFCGM